MSVNGNSTACTASSSCPGLAACVAGLGSRQGCSNTIQLTAATATADAICKAAKICDNSTYVGSSNTATHDTVCAPLTACTSISYERQAPTRGPDSNGQYTSDRLCAIHHAGCGTWQYAYSPKTATSAEVCKDLTTCTPLQYQDVDPTESTDRHCKDLTICPAGVYISKAATPSSDRECVVCPANHYKTATDATACVTNDTPSCYECVAQVDRKPGEYISGIPSKLNPHTYSACSACTAGEYVTHACGASSDQACGKCIPGVTFTNSTNAPGTCKQCKKIPALHKCSTACTVSADASGCKPDPLIILGITIGGLAVVVAFYALVRKRVDAAALRKRAGGEGKPRLNSEGKPRLDTTGLAWPGNSGLGSQRLTASSAIGSVSYRNVSIEDIQIV